MAKDILGAFEQLCLLALTRLGDNAYGRTIQEEIETRAKQQPSLGQIYVTLERLEEKGMVTSTLGEATPTRGGKPKRYFEITASGSASLNQSLNAIDAMRDTAVFQPARVKA